MMVRVLDKIILVLNAFAFVHHSKLIGWENFNQNLMLQFRPMLVLIRIFSITHGFIITLIGNLAQQINSLACFWEVGVNWNTWWKHTHTQGDLVKQTVTSAQDLNQVRWSCETETLDDVILFHPNAQYQQAIKYF